MLREICSLFCFFLFQFQMHTKARQIRSVLFNLKVSINRFNSEIKELQQLIVLARVVEIDVGCVRVFSKKKNKKDKWNRMSFKTKWLMQWSTFCHPFKTVIWTDIHCHFHNAAIQLFAQSNIMGRNSYEMADATSWTKSWKKDRPQFSELDCYCWKCTHFCE